MGKLYTQFNTMIESARNDLLKWGQDVDPGTWQGVPTDHTMHTREIMNYQASVFIGSLDVIGLQHEIHPNLPWADDHFEERVGGKPMNPDPSYVNWPWWKGQESSKQAGEQFTHTYSERFWPKGAKGPCRQPYGAPDPICSPQGIRYDYGDLRDVVDLLVREPTTRQATLPIFFPEDTGAVHGGRIPCTLHYHFLQRNQRLHMWYVIRSCDFVRHFRDDLYLAARLQLWVLQELKDQSEDWEQINPGSLHFTAYSLHYHRGDAHHV